MKFEQEKSIFPLYLTIIVVDQDLSFKKSESYFFMSNICHLIMGSLSENWCTSAHTNSYCRAVPFLYTDSIDILNSLKVSFLWKSVCAMSRVKNSFSLIFWALYFTIE